MGLLLTLTCLVIITVTDFHRNQVDTDKLPQSQQTSTSSTLGTVGIHQEGGKHADDIHFAGERFADTIQNYSKSQTARRRTPSRNVKRTTSPWRTFTKPRHSSHRFGNIHIRKTHKYVDQTAPPTKVTEAISSEHIRDFMKGDVLTKQIYTTFRNKTIAVYFYPETNRTIVIKIPKELQ